MTFAALLVHVQGGGEGRARLDCGVALAKRFEATLIGLAAEMAPRWVPDDGFYAAQAGWLEVVRESLEANLESARQAFEAASAALAKPTVWQSGIRLPTPAMASASRAADLIIASTTPGRHDDSHRNASPAELVITSGRPVLVVPSNGAELVGERIVLAWNDTREARRAMTDAMPFFKRSQQVLVLEYRAGAETRDAERRTAEVARALGRHGVSAIGKVVRDAASGGRILRHAEEFGADLIVAGGYGHSRLGEWVFGGVTRDLIQQDNLHALLSH